mmetsp:Transcript_32706/g.40193  ORF Transcript_32706/g.40193 Transcript_32706/m.40193 type:complete len:206 (-) Transcript_32706:407-1024(-)
MMRRECSCGALAMDQQLLALAIHEMLLHFGDVMGYIINHVHVQIFGRLVEDLRKCLSRQEGHGRTVHPGIVCCCRHCLQVVLTFIGMDPGTCQLPVVGADVVAGHGSLHVDQRVCGNLVSQTTATRMDHDTDLSFLVNAHLFGHKLIIDLVHHLDLRIVIPSAQGAQLWQSTLLCSAGYLSGIGIQHATILFTVFFVFRPCISFT